MYICMYVFVCVLMYVYMYVCLADDCTANVPTGEGILSPSACESLVTDATCIHTCEEGYNDNNYNIGQTYSCPGGVFTVEGVLDDNPLLVCTGI